MTKTVGELAGELRETARSLLPRYALLLRRAADALEREPVSAEYLEGMFQRVLGRDIGWGEKPDWQAEAAAISKQFGASQTVSAEEVHWTEATAAALLEECGIVPTDRNIAWRLAAALNRAKHGEQS